MNFDPINWKAYNKPPYLPQWLSTGETKKFVSFDDDQYIKLEGQIYELSKQWDIEAAKGILLDRIGKIVAEPRDGNDDELYRLLIKLRILLNTTRGNVNDIIKVIKFLYSSEVIEIIPNYPAALTIVHDGQQEYIDFNRILIQVIGAGIGYDTSELFNFADEVGIGEESAIALHSKFIDDFSKAGRIYHNGRVLRDGKTILGTELRAAVTRDGTHVRDGSITHTKKYKRATATDEISLPLLHGSGMRESLLLTMDYGTYEERSHAPVYRNGSITRDGSECHKPLGGNFAYDAMKIWIRKHHFHNGVYFHDGKIRHDGMILIRA